VHEAYRVLDRAEAVSGLEAVRAEETDVAFIAATAALLALTTLFAASACERTPEPPGTAPAQHAAPPALTEVQVYFTRDEVQEPVTRRVRSDAPLRGALGALLEGPTAEERRDGLGSWFSEQTAGMLRGVSIDEEGRAIVDFADFSGIIPNASTSAGSAMLLGELNQTVFQFSQIAEVEYRFEGSCDVFFNWLQRACTSVRRGELDLL
jgi:hypothetical protein